MHRVVLALVVLSACNQPTAVVGDSGVDLDTSCPRIAVSTASLTWTELLPGASGEASVRVTNDCEGETSLSVVASLGPTTDAGFDVSGLANELAPGEAADVVVVFASDEIGDHTGTLVIGSNDPTVGDVPIDLFASVGGDADGDGWPHDQDCDDGDAEVNPGAEETLDLVDEDCDGLVDEDFVEWGDVVFTELMINPAARPDELAEWFELENTTSHALDLVGWRFTNEADEAFEVSKSVRVEPGERVVFGASSDLSDNGGAEVQDTFGSYEFGLDDASGAMIAWVDHLQVAVVSWDADWPVESGRSTALDPDHARASDVSNVGNWCLSTSEMTGGDLGTPGTVNDDCSQLDEDGDGWTTDDGDCNDFDGDVHPGAPDPWNLVDDDCDGAIDQGDIDDVAVALYTGDSSDYGNYLSSGGLAIGDLDDDGIAEVVAGSPMAAASYQGEVYAVDASAVSGAEEIDNVAELIVQGGWTHYFGFLPPVLGDQTGDGVVDLVIGGSSAADSDDPSLGVYEGGASLTGELDEGDTTWTLVGLRSTTGVKVESALDFDGDGLDDLVRSEPSQTSVGSVAVLFAASLVDELDLGDDSDAMIDADGSGDYLGYGLGGGDLDGDGLDDLLIGAPGGSGGAWYVVPGAAMPGDGDISDLAIAAVTADDSGDLLGGPARPVVADFDGDGAADVVLSGAAAESIYLFLGAGELSGEVEASAADVVVTGGSGLGFGMAAADRDGDGVTDLLVGEVGDINRTWLLTWYSAYAVDYGAVWLFDGAALASGEVDTTDDAVGGATSSDQQMLGSALAAGDLDADGDIDVAVGAARASGRQGGVFIVR